MITSSFSNKISNNIEININDINIDYFNLNELVTDSRTSLDNLDILQKGTYIHGETSGLFDSSLWVVKNTLYSDNSYINFNELSKLKFKNIYLDDINLIKCWIVELILATVYIDENEYYVNLKRISYKYRSLCDFIKTSSNFHSDFISSDKNLIEEYFNLKPQSTKYESLYTIVEYLNFIIDKCSDDNYPTMVSYLDILTQLLDNTDINKTCKILPSSVDVIKFSNYVALFFNDNSIKKDLKLLFMPILLWWKITMIIPMRPSEFCANLSRNCLINEGDNYFLNIKRVKHRPNLKLRTLPVVNKLSITKEIYDLVSDYIELTDKFGYSKTLISYRAIEQLRYKLKIANPQNKIDKDKFSISILYSLLNSFYKLVIESIYKDNTIIDRISPNDTRHFAFTSLILQGVSPIEIAILGGHRTLYTLDSYTSSTNFYIDLQLMNFINESLPSQHVNRFNLRNFVFSQPTTCPEDIDKCVKVDEVGYCTASINEISTTCEGKHTIPCPKYWCTPSTENYKILENKLNEEIKFRKKHQVDANIDFIIKLFTNTGLTVVNNDLVVDQDIVNNLKSTVLKINSNINRIVELSYTLSNDSHDATILPNNQLERS